MLSLQIKLGICSNPVMLAKHMQMADQDPENDTPRHSGDVHQKVWQASSRWCIRRQCYVKGKAIGNCHGTFKQHFMQPIMLNHS